MQHSVPIETDVAIGFDLRLKVEATRFSEVVLAERANELRGTGNRQHLAMTHPLELWGI